MTMLKMDGEPLADASVMGHVHEGVCDPDATPEVGPHYRHDLGVALETSSNEVHMMWTTNALGMGGDTAVCNVWPLRSTITDPEHGAASIVLHESHENPVEGAGAKKLCCNLVWTSVPAADHVEHDAGSRPDPIGWAIGDRRFKVVTWINTAFAVMGWAILAGEVGLWPEVPP